MALTKATQSMIKNGWFDVTDYGAVGNNSHDDTSKIQSAIDSAIAAGGVLYFPAGEYKTTGTLNFSGRLTIQGIGDNTKCVIKPSGNFTAAHFGGASDGTIVIGLSIDAQTNNTSNPLVIIEGRNFTIDNCWFLNSAWDGIQLGSASESVLAVRINNTRITGGSAARAAGRSGITTEFNIDNTTCYFTSVYVGTFGIGINSIYNIIGGGINNIVETSNTGVYIANRDQTWVNTYFEANITEDFWVGNAGANLLGFTGSAVVTYQSSIARDESVVCANGAVSTSTVSANQVVVAPIGTSEVSGIGALQAVSTTTGALMGLAKFNAASSGPVLTFAKSRNPTIGGHSTLALNDYAGYLQFLASDGSTFGSAAAIAARMDAASASTKTPARLVFSTATNATPSVLTERVAVNSAGVWYPITDNTQNLGAASNRWATVYAGTPTINTSDAREKTFLSIENAEKAAALEIKANLRKFKFNDAIAKKGDDARVHFGASAQQVNEIMQKHGLDATKYGFFCHDVWEATEDQPAGDRYGLRYEELLAFIISAL